MIEVFKDQISDFLNPFDCDKVAAIHIHYYPSSKWMGSIEFKNNMTEGTQKFESSHHNHF